MFQLPETFSTHQFLTDALINLLLAIYFSKYLEIILKNSFPYNVKRAIGQKSSTFEDHHQSVLGGSAPLHIGIRPEQFFKKNLKIPNKNRLT